MQVVFVHIVYRPLHKITLYASFNKYCVELPLQFVAVHIMHTLQSASCIQCSLKLPLQFVSVQIMHTLHKTSVAASCTMFLGVAIAVCFSVNDVYLEQSLFFGPSKKWIPVAETGALRIMMSMLLDIRKPWWTFQMQSEVAAWMPSSAQNFQKS